MLAPVVLIVSAFLVLAVMPFGIGMAPVNIPSGLLYLVAVSSLSSLGIFLAGWSSRNKYALLGSMRAVAQLVSYEVPQVLSTVPVVLWTGSLSLVAIFDKQLEYGWFLFSPPGLVAFAILLIANIAEVNRTPFDLPEAESEIIAGYHTEYSGMRFGLFFLAEYLSVFGVSCLGTILFLGGGSLPFTDFPTNLLGIDVAFVRPGQPDPRVGVCPQGRRVHLPDVLGPGDASADAGGPADELRLEVSGADEHREHPGLGGLVRVLPSFVPFAGLDRQLADHHGDSVAVVSADRRDQPSRA